MLREGKIPTLHPPQLPVIIFGPMKQSRDRLAKYNNTVSQGHHKLSWLENISNFTDVGHFSALNSQVPSMT